MINLLFNFLSNIGNMIVPFLMKQVLFSSIIFFIILLLVKITKRLSPYWHLGLWTLVLFRLVLPPNFTHSYSLTNMMNQLPYYQQLSSYFVGLFSSASIDTESKKNFSIFSNENQFVGNESANVIHFSDKRHLLRQAIIFSTWFAGVIIFSLIYLKRIRKFQKLINESVPLNSARMALLLNKWQRQFQIKRCVQIVNSEKFLSPFTLGLFRPKIFIPQYFLESGHLGNLEAIIAHEMAHIKRRDDLWLKIQYVIQILYFFHPVAWYVNSKINLARECLCDRMVLSQRQISSESYGRSMMNVLKLNLFGAGGLQLLPGFFGHKNALKYRINNINGGTTMKHTRIIIQYASVFILGLLILPMAGSSIKNTVPTAIGMDVLAQQVDTNSPKEAEIPFISPIKQGKISAPFGKWIDPFTKKEAFHNGIDIATPKGTGIFAAADGIVEIATSEAGPGKHILLQHENGYQTFYSHCDTLLVQVGQQVKAGNLIARVGNSGRATGSHLHFEIRKDGKSMDPQKYYDFNILECAK